MVAVANLAIVNQSESGMLVDEKERSEMKATVVRLKRAEEGDGDDVSNVEDKHNGVRRFFRKVTSLEEEAIMRTIK
jgi:hypothetical protein